MNLESIRELLIQEFRIVYTLSSQGGVEILAVRHSKRPFSGF
jgi:plasmid stabilization system protein ParE